MHAIARVAIFRDERLVETHPELAVKSTRTGEPGVKTASWSGPILRSPKCRTTTSPWPRRRPKRAPTKCSSTTSASRPKATRKTPASYFQTEHPDWHRSDVIADFLKHAYAEIHPTGVLLSLDVFGIMAWQRPVDLAHTGQDIVRMAKYCDVLSPMIYPSHFFGMDGIARPVMRRNTSSANPWNASRRSPRAATW